MNISIFNIDIVWGSSPKNINLSYSMVSFLHCSYIPNKCNYLLNVINQKLNQIRLQFTVNDNQIWDSSSRIFRFILTSVVFRFA